MLDDLESLARAPSFEKRSALLRRITDLFFDGATRNVSEIALFEEVVVRLAREADLEARAGLADAVADRAEAPPALVRLLARDAIEVARAVLERSPVLGEADLVPLARTAGDGHLQAISRRAALPTLMTDILIERGSPLVLHLVAGNEGARLSEAGAGALVARSGEDEVLQRGLARRTDLPDVALADLAGHMAEALRRQAGAIGLDMLDGLHPDLLQALKLRLQRGLAERDREARTLGVVVNDIRAGVSSVDRELPPLARADRAYDLAAVLAELTGIDHATAMKTITGPADEPMVVLFRAVGMGWEAFEAMLQLRARRLRRAYVRSPLLARTYEDTDQATAQRVLRFLKLRRGGALGPTLRAGAA